MLASIPLKSPTSHRFLQQKWIHRRSHQQHRQKHTQHICNADERLSPKFQFLHSKGASTSDIVCLVNVNGIGYLFRGRPSIFLSTNLREIIDEVKEMGFDSSKITFVIALDAMRFVKIAVGCES
ncbi:hypothetical protein V8G54_034126 [Vigna mungo]|uniref:Uncharacterized protein n=1 Tax=Vigna mungo TaxID=3915 RepID=A0AAQ3RJN5_VIGMU